MQTPPNPHRRFSALNRLYGADSDARLRAARIAVVGLGGVGSWSAEALARCGVGQLVLIDLDHIAESNINRQLHALNDTLGLAKVAAMAQRIAAINPACRVQTIDDFVAPENAASYLAPNLDVIVDCTDQVSAKIAMILLARTRKQRLVVCGAVGGKTDPLALRVGDLAQASHDALLAKLRNLLRNRHGYAKATTPPRKPRANKMHVQALWVEQAAVLPSQWPTAPQGLSCAGYGSVVMVTAAMGLAAANVAVQHVIQNSPV